MSYIEKTVGESVVLALLLTKDGAPLSGLSPTLEIRRNADQLYFDFSASIAPYWIASGGQQLLNLPEAAWLPGYYTWNFNQGLYDSGKNDYTVIYRNDPPYPTTSVEIVSFTNEFVFDVSFIRKMLANKQTLKQLAADHMQHKVFDDDELTQIYEADITIDTMNAIETRDPV
jgi:hypothetical protein